MKRLLALLFSLMMMFAFVACNNTDDPDNPSSGGDPRGIIENPEYDPYDPEQYIYKSVFANSPYKDQWDTGRFGASLYGIWDSSVLPEVFPEKPDSVTSIDRTSFVGLLDEKIGNYAPGELYVEVDYDTDERLWTYFYVMFEGTEATLNSLIADIASNFEYEDDRDNSWGDRIIGDLHAYSKDWYVYLWYSQDTDWVDDGYVVNENFSFTLYAVPVHHTLPTRVEGLNLPQFGYLLNGAFELIGYSDGDDDYTYIDYDFESGTASGALKENWSTSGIEYYGATLEDAESYAQYLVSQGYEKTYDSRQYDATSYSLSYKKGDMMVDIEYESGDKCVTVRVTYGDTGLFYY